MGAMRRVSVVVLYALFGFSTAHLADGPPAAAFTQPSVVTFSAWDHSFEGPDVIPAGQTTIRLHNGGREPHQLQLLKLDEGKSPADLAAVLQEPGTAIPQWAKHMGGPNGVGSGGDAEATIFLEPGSYVLICVIPAEHQRTHAALGMQKALLVTGNLPSAAEFRGNFHMAMFDYEFVVVQPLKKGRHIFYVINRGSQPHQVSLVRLDPGASAADVLAAFGKTVLPSMPGQMIGGMSGLEPGGEGMFSADFAPGRYVMICLFPNPTAHDSHAAKGMVMNFTIE
jgi:hypothetical protein